MKEIEIVKMFMKHLIDNKLIQNQQEFGVSLGYANKSSFSQLLKRDNVSSEFMKKLHLVYPSYINFSVNYKTSNSVSKLTTPDYIHSDGKFSETKRFPKEVIIITAKAGLNLQSNYYADELLEDLDKRVIYLDHDAKGRYFEIDSTGDSMNDGSIDSIADGDKLLLREVPRIYWKDKFHINKWDFTFFHYDKGFITKKIKEHNVETGDLLLESRNPDKDQYPDFWINLKECAIVTNVVEVRRQKGVYY